TEILFLGWFGNCVVPAKLGDAYRAYLLRRNSPVSFPTALGTIMAEGIMDMAVIFLLLVGAVIAGLGLASGAVALWVLGAGFGLVLLLTVGLVVLYRFGGHIAVRLPSRLRPFYQNLQHGILSSLHRLPLLAFLSVLIWLAEAGRLFLVSRSLGFSLSVPLTLFVALASAILTLFPLTPAGLGLVEGGIVGLLMLAAFSKEDALSVALLDRSISYWSILLFGAVLLVLSRKK
ncbi:MAG: flippase-like domain-containing protein, partial [Chloroflexota bacterium]|nr:flippase-like domain-containing protein [Chloroflexota bacterium]